VRTTAAAASRARREKPGQHIDGVRALEAEARRGAADAADFGPQVRQKGDCGVQALRDDVVQRPQRQGQRPGEEQRRSIVQRQQRPKGRQQQRGRQAAARRCRGGGGGGLIQGAALALALAVFGLHRGGALRGKCRLTL